MNAKIFSDAMSGLDSKYVDEALNYKKKTKKYGRIKPGALAACFTAAIVLSAVLSLSGIFPARTDVATLSNGEMIVFVKSDHAGNSMTLDLDVIIRPLTEAEAEVLFPGLSVTAIALFQNSGADTGAAEELLGFEGQIGNIKMIISTSGVQLIDTEIAGAEKNTEINGTDVTAGYFVTDPNSRGEQNAIYYASFEMGGCIVYLENAGTKDDSETTKMELAEVIQELTENGELDLTSYLEG